MILVILAAGKGKRLKNKTKNVPKCLVKINKRSIIDYNLNFINKFKKTILITGFKSNLIIKKFKKNNNIKIIKNKKYQNTNMVYSFFSAYKFLQKQKKDVLISYSDIIFDQSLFNNINKRKSFIFANTNWLSYWKKRMTMSDIKKDAEDLVVKNNKLISIGSKINDKLPKLQFMGLIKIEFKNIKRLFIFFKKLKNPKIDFTNFINLALKNKIIELYIIKTNKFWIEIDSKKDLQVSQKLLLKRH